MGCEEFRRAVALAFDHGESWEVPEGRSHRDQCEECRSYESRLNAVDSVLRAPDPLPDLDLAPRVRRALATRVAKPVSFPRFLTLYLLVGAASFALYDPLGLATGLAHLGQGTLGQAWLDTLYLTLYGGVLFWLLGRPSPAGVRLGR